MSLIHKAVWCRRKISAMKVGERSEVAELLRISGEIAIQFKVKGVGAGVGDLNSTILTSTSICPQ